MGKKINEAKQLIQASMDEANKRIEESELLSSLGPTVDPTLPSPDKAKGVLHPIAQVRDQVVELFQRIGFAVAEGTELETEYYCFDALNIAKDHPARDMQDSYFMPDATQMANVSKESDENICFVLTLQVFRYVLCLRKSLRFALLHQEGVSAGYT